MFATIIADIADSRRNLSESRSIWQLDGVSWEGTYSKIRVYKHDELEVVVSDFSRIPKIIRTLRYKLRPNILRVGVGFGDIRTDSHLNLNEENNPYRMTGESFYLARDALSMIGNRTQTQFSTGDIGLDSIIDALYLLMDRRIRDWTEKQWNAVMEYEAKGTQKEAALALGISRSALARRLHSADYDAIDKSEKLIIDLICNKFR